MPHTNCQDIFSGNLNYFLRYNLQFNVHTIWVLHSSKLEFEIHFPSRDGISYDSSGQNHSTADTIVPGAPVKADSTSTWIPCSRAISTLRSWSTCAPFSMSRSIFP